MRVSVSKPISYIVTFGVFAIVWNTFSEHLYIIKGAKDIIDACCMQFDAYLSDPFSILLNIFSSSNCVLSLYHRKE